MISIITKYIICVVGVVLISVCGITGIERRDKQIKALTAENKELRDRNIGYHMTVNERRVVQRSFDEYAFDEIIRALYDHTQKPMPTLKDGLKAEIATRDELVIALYTIWGSAYARATDTLTYNKEHISKEE